MKSGFHSLGRRHAPRAAIGVFCNPLGAAGDSAGYPEHLRSIRQRPPMQAPGEFS
jgi:hypothetical protein